LTTLTERIVALHRHLTAAELPHAFGGALALAFCTQEPRATKDIDLNVFVRPTRIDLVTDALPSAVTVTDEDERRLRRDGQSRLWWGDTPVDLFLSNHPFHDHAAANRRAVPFAGVDDLPVLACADLAVFKCFFARPKDAVDVTTMVQAGSVDLTELEQAVTALLGGPDDRSAFFARIRQDLGSSD